MRYVRLSDDTVSDSDGLSDSGRRWNSTVLRSAILVGCALLALSLLSYSEVLPGSFLADSSSTSTVAVSTALDLDEHTSAHSYVLQWQNSTGSTSSLHFCSFRNLCISGRPEGSRRVEWFLNGQEKSPRDTAAFAKIFKRCFHTMYKKDDHFAIRKHVSAVQVPGNTLAFFKDEPGNHPASWSRVWAPVTSLLVKGSTVLRDLGISAIDHIQLFEQKQKLNGWAAFIMNMALKSGHDYASTWSDDALFINTTETTCFDRVLATGENDGYFLDPEVAEVFRQNGYDSVGLPSVRKPACEPSGLRVVFLRRDRPFWNEDDIMQIMRKTTPNLHIQTIDSSMPYQIQVDMFAQADILVSVHGSHLGNQLFMRPGAGLVEVFPHFFYHPEQTHLAALTGVDHVKLTNNPLVPRSLVTPEFIPLLNRVELGLQQFPSAEQCMPQFNCRNPSALLGVYANVEEFATQYRDLVQRVISRC